MTKKNVIIYGGGKLGLYLHSLIMNDFSKEYQIIGFVDDILPTSNNHCGSGLPLFGKISELDSKIKFKNSKINLFLGIGYKDLKKRLDAFRVAKRMGYNFETLVHHSSIICSEVKIEEGCFIGPGSVIDYGSKLSFANFIDTKSVVGEFTQIGEGNYISSNSTLCGRVSMGNCNFLGASSTISNEINIGNNNEININIAVIRNIKNNFKVIENRKIYYLN